MRPTKIGACLRGSLLGLLATSVVLGIGCNSGPAPAGLASWRDAVVATQEHSDVVLRGVNELAREAQLQRAAQLSNLKESDFEPALDAQSLAIWNGAFDDLAAYAQALAKLVDPATSAPVGPSLTKLSQTLAAKANAEAFQQHPGLASAIGKFGAAIAGAAARAEAREIMRQTDGDINDLLGEMSRMIGSQEGGVEIGIVATVRATWTDRANEKRVAFLDAGSADARMRIAREYAQLLESRSAADRMLRDLKRSLESLAASHTAAAQGSSRDVSSLIATLREQTALAQSILDDLRKTQP